MPCRGPFAAGFLVFLLLCAPTGGWGEESSDRVERIKKLLAASPDNGGLMYELAAAETAAGHSDAAIQWLEKAVGLGYDFELQKEPRFAPLRKSESFRALDRLLSRRPPARASVAAFLIADPELIPEGIAWDPAGRGFYVGSLYKKKILHVGPDARARDFTASGQDGLWAVLGMKVDPRRRILWVNSAADGREEAAKGSSGLFAFDLATGRLLEKHLVAGHPREHLFNDLVVTAGGDVLLTDSEAGSLWRLARGAAALQEFLPAGTFQYPNGIALDGGEGRLYVADSSKGISIVEIATKKTRPLPHPSDVPLHSVDGLYAYGASLVAIQNGPGMERVVQFRLDPAGERVEGVRVIESRNAHLKVPTTGAVAGSDFFYIANSQLENLGDDGKLKAGAKLENVRILRAPLD
jgi:hypothetical protein